MSELEQNLTRARAYLKQFDGKGVLNRIGGQDSAGIGWFDTTSPVDGAHLAQVARGDRSEMDRAAEAAKAAFPAWRDMGGKERKQILHNIADAIEAQAEEIAFLECLDTGQALRFMSKAALRGAENFRYFADLAKFVSDGLAACGYVYCPGDMMATNSRWCQPVAKWRDYFRGWIGTPNPEAQMLASVMFDLRPIGGSSKLFGDLQAETLDAAAKNSIFVAHMVANSLKHAPPLGLLRGFATIRSGEHRNTIDMKHSGVVPVTDRICSWNEEALIPAARASSATASGERNPVLTCAIARAMRLAWLSTASRLRSTSPASRHASTMPEESGCSCLRTMSSSVSMTWVTSVMSLKPKVPLEPLIEWAARNKAFKSSASGASTSIDTSRFSMDARCSAASSKNTW